MKINGERAEHARSLRNKVLQNKIALTDTINKKNQKAVIIDGIYMLQDQSLNNK